MDKTMIGKKFVRLENNEYKSYRIVGYDYETNEYIVKSYCTFLVKFYSSLPENVIEECCFDLDQLEEQYEEVMCSYEKAYKLYKELLNNDVLDRAINRYFECINQVSCIEKYLLRHNKEMYSKEINNGKKGARRALKIIYRYLNEKDYNYFITLNKQSFDTTINWCKYTNKKFSESYKKACEFLNSN